MIYIKTQLMNNMKNNHTKLSENVQNGKYQRTVVTKFPWYTIFGSEK